MKRITVIFLVAVMAGMLLISCDRKEPVIDDRSFNYELIGAEHNAGLEYVFNYLKNSKVQTISYSRRELLDLAEAGTRDFLEKSRMLNTFDRIIAMDESEKPFVFYAGMTDHLKSATLDKLWPSEVDHILTKKQKMILEEIDQILNDNSSNVQTVIEKLRQLDDRIQQECSSGEKHVLLCATAIGRHSCQYWHDNLCKWEEVFEPESGLKGSKAFSWSAVGKNDVAYGVGGGIAGAITGGSVSLGILTVPGWAAGAIGGAISGSVGSAILQIL